MPRSSSSHKGMPLFRANAAAAEAAGDWLLARGLIAEIEVIRRALPAALPVPGIEELLGVVGSAADEAGAAADAVYAALHDSDDPADDPLIRQSVVTATDAADRARLGLRRLAQVMLGVSSHAGGQAATYRAERAAVMVIVGDQDAVPSLPSDGAWWASCTPEEFAVELAGAICRLILEQSWRLRITHEHGSIDIEMHDGGILKLDSSFPPLPAQYWSDPLPVLEVVNEVIDVLRPLIRRDIDLFDQLQIQPPGVVGLGGHTLR